MASNSMNPVVHFEMPAEDRTRMRKFYENTFGWKTEQLGPEMGDYVLVVTTETDKNRHPKTPGSINGGFYPKKEDWPAQYPSVVVAVDDIKASMKKEEAAGARSLASPWKFRDTDSTSRSSIPRAIA
jgi:predicted enzyme related to lactoylglutathione lyase